MLNQLFQKHLIADAQEFMQDLHRVNLFNGAMSPTMNRHKLQLVTGSDRVDELIQEIVLHKGKEIDVTVQSCATGNRNYIEWVRKHTNPDHEVAEKPVEVIVWEMPDFKAE